MNYDFKIISEQYPKSFKKLKGWIADGFLKEWSDIRLHPSGKIGMYAIPGMELRKIFNPLELTAFFDGKGIMGVIGYNSWEGNNSFYYHFNSITSVSESFPTRELALTACFNKCFQILEERL